MVTGSLALAAYATPRMTRDIDLVVDLEPADVDRVVSLFESDCFIEPQAVRDAVERRSMFNIIHTEWVIKADFVVRADEDYRREEFRRRQTISVEGQPIWFVTPEDLLLSKLVWNLVSPSEQQERDARDLLTAVEDLDFEYIARWAEPLGVADSLERLRT